ncbi:low temperature requirement protein A [Streptomyces sp. NY05-11A]|uniref:low temperature requirement protein A n=1 Tax=Streptomyces soliscabiei TaxID=588897 RepID=UPI0039F72E99
MRCTCWQQVACSWSSPCGGCTSPGRRTCCATTHQAHRRRFTSAYGHYLIFASAAAEGAGLATYAKLITRRTDVPSPAAGVAITMPLAIFLVTVWAVHVRPHQPSGAEQLAFPAVAVAALAAARSPAPALIAGLLAAVLVVVVTVADRTERVRH